MPGAFKAFKAFFIAFLCSILFFQTALASFSWTEIYKVDAENIAFYDHFSHGSVIYGATLNLTNGTEVWQWNPQTGVAGRLGNAAGMGNGLGQGSDIPVVWSMAYFVDLLRVGVGNNNHAQVWSFDSYNYSPGQWTPMASTGFSANDINVRSLITSPDEYDLYAGTANTTSGAKVYAFDIGTNSWSSIGNFEEGANIEAITSMIYFNNKLYIGTKNPTDGANVYRYDGAGVLTKLATAGFGDAANNLIVPEMTVFKNKLYAMTGGEWLGTTGPLEIYSYDGSNWSKVVGEGKTYGKGFGDADNIGFSLISHNDNALYVSTKNETAGGEVWYSPDAVTWTQVAENGFGKIVNYVISALEVVGSNSWLAAGTFNLSGAEVYRIDTSEIEGSSTLPATGKATDRLILSLAIVAVYGLYILPKRFGLKTKESI